MALLFLTLLHRMSDFRRIIGGVFVAYVYDERKFNQRAISVSSIAKSKIQFIVISEVVEDEI